jgi:membrane protein required for colicin V production
MIGIFFGVARGSLVVAVLVLIGGMTPMPQDPWWHESQLLHYFQDMAIWMRQFLPAEIAKSIRYEQGLVTLQPLLREVS